MVTASTTSSIENFLGLPDSRILASMLAWTLGGRVWSWEMGSWKIDLLEAGGEVFAECLIIQGEINED